MVANNSSPLGTNFTVSIEAAEGVTTGISAADRARTVRAAVRADAGPADLVQPGHIFPLMAQKGGVLVRAGHTEAGCDLAQLAGAAPAAVICEILKDNGEMARLPDLIEFAREHGLKIGTIADLIQYRSRTESLVERVSERDVETVHGAFRLVVYADRIGEATHLALWAGLGYSAIDTYVFQGKAPWTFRNRADHTALEPAAKHRPIAYPKPDGKLSFDRLSSVFISNTNHEENQPSHLTLKDASVPVKINLNTYDAPETRYCPAGVYEIVREADGTNPRLQINAQNCVHCKTCDIKDPTQNIRWVVPQGGGGPNYPNM